MAGLFLLIGVQNCLTNVTRGHSIASHLKAAMLKEMNCNQKVKGRHAFMLLSETSRYKACTKSDCHLSQVRQKTNGTCNQHKIHDHLSAVRRRHEGTKSPVKIRRVISAICKHPGNFVSGASNLSMNVDGCSSTKILNAFGMEMLILCVLRSKLQ